MCCYSGVLICFMYCFRVKRLMRRNAQNIYNIEPYNRLGVLFYSSKNGYKNGAQRGLGSTAIWWTFPARPFPCKDGIPDENVQADEDPPKQSVEFPALW